MTLLPLLALLAAEPADSAAAVPDDGDVLHVLLGADRAGERPVPGVVLVSLPDSVLGAATLRLASAAPARLWWRGSAAEACADSARGGPVLDLPRLSAGEAYFCARPVGGGPLRLAATLRAGTLVSTAVAELARAGRGGISPTLMAVLTALLGLVSGIVVNHFTARNQLRSDLAKRRQELDAEERGKRLQVVGAVHGSLLAEIQRALLELREYAASPPPPAEAERVLKVGGIQVVMTTEVVRAFLEDGEGRQDFERLRRIYALMGGYNRAVRHEPDLVKRRALARRTAEEIEAQLPA